MSINSLCQQAGVAKPSLYRLFGNEDGLMAAVLDAYADSVLAEIFAMLQRHKGVAQCWAALTEFAAADPRMQTGCLFFKMRAGKHRLGPKTQDKIDEIDQAAQQGFEAFMRAQPANAPWRDEVRPEAAARFLKEQLAWAVTRRAAGEDPAHIRTMMGLALRALHR